MNREIYAEDDMIILCKITDDDKENYCQLFKQVSSTPKLYFDVVSKESVWDTLKYLSDLNYSIFDKSGNYCGNIMLQRPASSTPEIGVDIMERHRNKGIAVRAIKLIARRYYNENQIDHFTIRALEENTHSRHMIEKTGAVFLMTENPSARMISGLREAALNPENADIKEKLLDKANTLENCSDRAFVYALYHNAFL